MKTKTKQRTLLLALVAIALSTVLIVGGTYALFTGDVRVNNHLSAGKLEIGLYRTSYTEHVLGANGLMSTKLPDTDPVDLVENRDKLFNITDLAVPTAWYEATLEVSNLGSVAFDYGVRMIWEENDAERPFAEQIRITVTSATVTKTFMLTACEDVDLGSILRGGEAQSFTVKAEFVDDVELNTGVENPDDLKDNDVNQNAGISFDVQVYAVQKVSA